MKSSWKLSPALVLRGNKPVTMKPMRAHTSILSFSPNVATTEEQGGARLELQMVGWRDVVWTLQLLLLAPYSNYALGPTSSLMSRKRSTHPPRETTVVVTMVFATMTYTSFAIGSMLRPVSACVAQWRGLRPSCHSYLLFPFHLCFQ